MYMRLMTGLRSLFCKHEYVKMRDRHYAKHRGFVIVQGVYKCKKCGKVVYRE